MKKLYLLPILTVFSALTTQALDFRVADNSKACVVYYYGDTKLVHFSCDGVKYPTVKVDGEHSQNESYLIATFLNNGFKLKGDAESPRYSKFIFIRKSGARRFSN